MSRCSAGLSLKYKDSCDPARFNKWFNMILYNSLRDYKREELGRGEEEFIEDTVEGHPCSHYPDQVMREIDNMISTKLDHHQEILRLHYQKGYTPKNISEITGYSNAMCGKVIERFRNELKDIYQ